MEFGVQIVSTAVILTLIVSFFSNRRLPLLSTRLFTCFILVALFNIIFEFTTLYTIYRLDSVEPWVNRLCHQFFIASLDFTIFCLFLYVDVKARKQERYTTGQIIGRLIPIGVAVVTVIFGRLYYHVGMDGRYSYGPMAYMIYVIMAVFMFLTIYRLIRDRNSFKRDEKNYILYGIIVWMGISIIQFFHPTMLLSSMGVALMTLFLYLSFENPREYVDFEVPHVLNTRAYDSVIDERLAGNKVFYIISAAIVNEKLIRNSYGEQKVLELLDELAVKFEEIFHETVYRSDKYIISVILTQRKMEASKNLFVEMKRGMKSVNEIADLRLSILECPRFAGSRDEVKNVALFINGPKASFGKNELVVIDQAMLDKLSYQDTVEGIVQRAIKEDGLEVYYQPIYSTVKKKFVSAEALVRLKDNKTVGYISPELFIPIAEKRNLVDELDMIVFEKVCEFFSKYRLEDRGIEYIEVNLSGKQIVDPLLPGKLVKCVEKYGVSPKCINLEITETAAVEAEELLLTHMKLLQNAGFRFSMDDFGTGYSNLSEMGSTEFDLIKIDKSLIWPCFEENSKDARVILHACVEMIHNLGRHIVAEGVETEEQVSMLTNAGIAYLQGYYFSKPLPEGEYLEFMEQKS